MDVVEVAADDLVVLRCPVGARELDAVHRMQRGRQQIAHQRAVIERLVGIQPRGGQRGAGPGREQPREDLFTFAERRLRRRAAARSARRPAHRDRAAG